MLIIICRRGLDKVRRGWWNESWKSLAKMQEEKETGERSRKRPCCVWVEVDRDDSGI